jgi:heme-degrading monooxygenase HmoA
LIRHTAVFRLHHPAGSSAETTFLVELRKLHAIPGVEKFEVLRQTSRKNEFHFGVSMEFASQAAYDAYNTHPDHVTFVQNIWIPQVAAFTEIDYVAL